MKKDYNVELSNELRLIVRYATFFACTGQQGLNAIERKLYSDYIIGMVDKLNFEELDWLYKEYSKYLEGVNKIYEIFKEYNSSSKTEQNALNDRYRDLDDPELDAEARKSILFVYDQVEWALGIQSPTSIIVKNVFTFMNDFQKSFRNLIEDKKEKKEKSNNHNNVNVQFTDNGYIKNGVHYHYPNFNEEERHIQLK